MCHDELFRLKRAIRTILTDDEGHYRTDLSGADVIQDLTLVAEEFNCCPGATDAPDKDGTTP
jgi:hypothetical protein